MNKCVCIKSIAKFKELDVCDIKINYINYFNKNLYLVYSNSYMMGFTEEEFYEHFEYLRDYKLEKLLPKDLDE